MWGRICHERRSRGRARSRGHEKSRDEECVDEGVMMHQLQQGSLLSTASEFFGRYTWDTGPWTTQTARRPWTTRPGTMARRHYPTFSALVSVRDWHGSVDRESIGAGSSAQNFEARGGTGRIRFSLQNDDVLHTELGVLSRHATRNISRPRTFYPNKILLLRLYLRNSGQ